jgi:ribosomal protein L16 Arg81 hydroxylase
VSRRRDLGLTLTETLVAMFIFLLVSTACLLSFRNVIRQSPHRVMFAANIKQLDVSLEKITNNLQSSKLSGVGVTQLGPGSSALSIQKALRTNSLGLITWEEAIHLYWKNPDEDFLRYSKISKDDAKKEGLLLSEHFADRATADQLVAFTQAHKDRSKILVLNLARFDVSETWMFEDKALEIVIKAVNPRMQEQRYSAQRAVWLGR